MENQCVLRMKLFDAVTSKGAIVLELVERQFYFDSNFMLRKWCKKLGFHCEFRTHHALIEKTLRPVQVKDEAA